MWFLMFEKVIEMITLAGFVVEYYQGIS